MRDKLFYYVGEINAFLAGLFSGEEIHPGVRLNESMKYTLDSGGKRLRPILLCEFADMCGLAPERALGFACGVELIHTYSLVHDDLPCMDDDDLRRGMPTAHRVFGEAGAVLAGDALLNAAFELMLSEHGGIPAENILAAAAEIAAASGRHGMVAGQAMDIKNNDTPPEGISYEYLEKQSLHKTCALIRGACVAGVRLAGEKNAEKLRAAERYGNALGLAFQIKDDLLDVYGEENVLGKPVGSDRESGKLTFADILGVDGCILKIKEQTNAAVNALRVFEKNEFLLWIVNELAERRN